MNEDSLEFLSVVMNSPNIWKNREKYMNKYTDKKQEDYDMCQAIRELVEDGRQETLKKNVENLMKSLSINLERACELLGAMDDYENLKESLQKHGI